MILVSRNVIDIRYLKADQNPIAPIPRIFQISNGCLFAEVAEKGNALFNNVQHHPHSYHPVVLKDHSTRQVDAVVDEVGVTPHVEDVPFVLDNLSDSLRFKNFTSALVVESSVEVNRLTAADSKVELEKDAFEDNRLLLCVLFSE